MSILVFIESRDGNVAKASWQAVTQAKKLADKLGAPQILYWESDYIDLPDRIDDHKLAADMGNYAAGKV